MAQPLRFLVTEPFRHQRPEYVRRVAVEHGFECRTRQGTKESEIWVREDGNGGYWIIRMDAMGHDTRFHFGARPHYHKNWVDSDAMLRQYLMRFTPGASVYNDDGVLVGLAGGSGDMHPDQKAKVQHIPR
ncbi:MAG: hypothetical protein KF861_11365 [Planctomycetaceae bacterium]|nr:hypothetical protein [Planctomycetaceae bacterium]